MPESVATNQNVTRRWSGAGLDPDRVAVVRRKLDASGMTAKSWAEKEGYAPGLVRNILLGKKPCYYGKSHDIAVKLGLKDGEVIGG